MPVPGRTTESEGSDHEHVPTNEPRAPVKSFVATETEAMIVPYVLDDSEKLSCARWWVTRYSSKETDQNSR